MPENQTPSHDEALLALSEIRKATRAADFAREILQKAKRAFKEAKEASEAFDTNARNVARAQTYPLPLFDEADGIHHVEASASGTSPAPATTASKTRKDGDKEAVNAQFRPARAEDDAEIADLALPDEVLKALSGFGFHTIGMLKMYQANGCHWDSIPGIDAAGAKRIGQAIDALHWKALGIAPPVTEPGDDAGKDAA